MDNKEFLEKVNSAIKNGDNEWFLYFCTEDVKGIFVGKQMLKGRS